MRNMKTYGITIMILIIGHSMKIEFTLPNIVPNALDIRSLN